jgi:hypothetical protein
MKKLTYTSRKYFVKLNEDIVLFKKNQPLIPKIFCKLEREILYYSKNQPLIPKIFCKVERGVSKGQGPTPVATLKQQ